MATGAKDKIAARVAKLLRMAAPTSGATLPERESAAFEAARLFAEHDLDVCERKKAKRTPAAAPPPATPDWRATYDPMWPGYREQEEQRKPRTPPRPQHWEESYAEHSSFCADPTCGQPISQGDPVYLRYKGGYVLEYLHRESGPCLFGGGPEDD